ncbi:MAG: hypothetical protein COX90_02495 [Candidatus Nealsonbacteria bacterium CG_4_10_14_0_2_um_filter_38_17]|uniref:Uncharacterized protein n=2 Tax=Candidatus Nealsoniibacteriota TaxID=1817911 RepID=A0A2M7UXY5_9BACT|nr:MAG: hypothetical protein COX36_00550 [Candidatus Nealsonbacteria bacterium CG23_combo_of_CG06-09_8_20_14_all_38_19]PIZ88829.1 MAG: hypothetical protein COX90_02495 [Candidatus Nealsonbacteria bacterium CG_4_10_14_0_2_um_filter_38_17]
MGSKIKIPGRLKKKNCNPVKKSPRVKFEAKTFSFFADLDLRKMIAAHPKAIIELNKLTNDERGMNSILLHYNSIIMKQNPGIHIPGYQGLP